MRKFQCLLFVLKSMYVCYYIIYMTVPVRSYLYDGLVNDFIKKEFQKLKYFSLNM